MLTFSPRSLLGDERQLFSQAVDNCSYEIRERVAGAIERRIAAFLNLVPVRVFGLPLCAAAMGAAMYALDTPAIVGEDDATPDELLRIIWIFSMALMALAPQGQLKITRGDLTVLVGQT